MKKHQTGPHQKKAIQRLTSRHDGAYLTGLQDMCILMHFQHDPKKKPLTIEQANNRIALSILYN